jgi:hypothetical protein
MGRRRLALLLAAVAATSLIAGAGGFTSARLDRGVSVAVVGDDAAYVGVESPDRTLVNGMNREVPLVTLTNRFDAPLDEVRVSVADDDGQPPTVRTVEPLDRLPSGESVTVDAAVVCEDGPARSEAVTVQVEAAGEGVSVALNRTLTLECTGAPNRGEGGIGDPHGGDGRAVGASANGTATTAAGTNRTATVADGTTS